MRLSWVGVIGVLSVAAGMAGWACSTTTDGGGCVGPGAPNVDISNTRFCPRTQTINIGQTVTWTNLDGVTHTTVSDVGASDTWDSGNIVPNGFFARQFKSAGTYRYHCSIHTGMHGTIIVN